jgi:hypothetical protein
MCRARTDAVGRAAGVKAQRGLKLGVFLAGFAPSAQYETKV